MVRRAGSDPEREPEAALGELRHPAPANHIELQRWMRSQFGSGPIEHLNYPAKFCVYRADRRVGGAAVAYTLEVTQEALERDGVARIVTELQVQQTAERLRANPRTSLRYLEGGRIVRSPRQRRRRAGP